MDVNKNIGVIEFYQDSTILITGATGFTGQVLLEKILRSLKPRKIYVLVREKRGVKARKEVKQLFSNVLFEQVRQDNLLCRVIPVDVDFDQEHLSLDEALRENLANEVDVLFNLLASVNFNEPLASAFQTNVEYSRNLLQLASTFHHLKAVIHVSTFYSNCDRTTIEELIYPDTSFGGYENVRAILNQLKPTERDVFSPFILGKQPNTYTYSKKCAESMINDNFSQLPVGIFRPPIVSSTFREPFPDWYYKYNGPCGILMALYFGLLNVLPFEFDKRTFVAPVDYCINAMLCCAVDVYKKHCQQSTDCIGKVQVYNFTDGTRNCSWEEAYRWYLEGMTPLRTYLRARFLTLTSNNKILCEIGFYWMRVRAHFIDFIAWALGKKSPTAATATTERIITQVKLLRPFCVQEWGMGNSNMMKVVEGLSVRDKLRFPCDLRNVDLEAHLRRFIPGVLKYVVNAKSVA
ncbi:fatty acyl-CoA reductase 1-like [Aedes albopictus]|uniref:Fatty acyl-CoA reductase n=1 Tax=Aedes albopictus TaxID=7160 RepID=A0ABM1Z7W7_AEDAL